jgi:nitrite reductase (NADH) large subunit
VKTEEEVLEWSGAYLQYYRETGKYGERTSEWIERVGLDTVKAALDKKEDRDALNERIDKTLSLMQDPWKEIIEEQELNATFVPIVSETTESVLK